MTQIIVNERWMPEKLHALATSFTTTAITANTHKFAYVGRHKSPTGSSKNIRKFGLLFGAVTKGGSTTLTGSLQGIDLTAGGLQPNGTQDQTVAIPNADIVADTFYMTGALSADRAAAHGALLGCVLEYNVFNASDSIGFKNLGTPADNANGCALFNGTSWGTTAVNPNLIFEYDDGTRGKLESGIILSAITTQQFASNSTPDEYALKFQMPDDGSSDAVWIYLGTGANTRDLNIRIEDGSGNSMIGGALFVDANTIRGTGAAIATIPTPVWNYSKNTVYYLTVEAATTSNNNISILTVANANHWDAMWGGQNWHLASRTNLGAWTPTTTQRPMMGLRVFKNDDGDGAGASGGFSPLGGPF